MIGEALLAYLHIGAVLGWVVFLTSQTALLRPEWINAAVLARLQRVGLLANLAALAVLATGLARLGFGLKGAAWYGHQPLLWIKLAVTLALAWQGWRATRRYAAWLAAGGLPPVAELDATRRLVFRVAHWMLIVPVAGVMLARGIGTV